METQNTNYMTKEVGNVTAHNISSTHSTQLLSASPISGFLGDCDLEPSKHMQKSARNFNVQHLPLINKRTYIP
jgi:hypothetical protein